MNKSVIEKNIVAVLFVLVLVTFSFAERDTKKLEKLYRPAVPAAGAVTMQSVQQLRRAHTSLLFADGLALLPHTIPFIVPAY